MSLTSDHGRVLLGEVLWLEGDPGDDPHSPLVRHWSDGAIWLRDGQVAASGARTTVLAQVQRAAGAQPVPVDDHRPGLILPGLIDCHLHYVQVGMLASWGRQLLDWLRNYTFPAEAACADPRHAEALAGFVLDRLLAHGTTTASVFASVHAHSVDAFMEGAAARGLRMLCGKVMMDRNCPAGLQDSVATNAQELPALIQRWHGHGRLRYTLTPRFAPTSTPAQLALAGALFQAHPDLHVQSHLSENHEELAWVRSLFPDAPDYLAVYEQAGLTGPRSIYGHCLHLTPRERAALAQGGTAVAFCPTSNLFLGSGTLDAVSLLDAGVAVGLATDIGAGSSLSLLRTLGAAYQHSQLAGRPLSPLRLWYLATLGGAQALGLDGLIGQLAAGHEADCVVLDAGGIPELALRVRHAGTLAERLFALAMLGDERCVRATYVAGHCRHDRQQAASHAPVGAALMPNW